MINIFAGTTATGSGAKTMRVRFGSERRARRCEGRLEQQTATSARAATLPEQGAFVVLAV